MGSDGFEKGQLLLDQPIFSPRPMRVVCIGAGFAGLMLAHRIKNDAAASYIDLQIYEKNAGIGGTWFENRYPGAACDVPSHIYTFPFAPNPSWSRFYSSSSEILQYINDTAATFGLNAYVQLNSRVISAVWSDKTDEWIITYDQRSSDTNEFKVMTTSANVLIDGSGILNRKKTPDIPGLDTFKGTIMHSAAWNPTLDWAGKRIGIIGNGSSAIQIVPQLQPAAAKLVEYIRTPTWIIPEFLSDFTPDGTNFEYTAQQKKNWEDNPTELRDLRRKMEHAFNTYFGIFKQASPNQAYVREAFTQLMRTKLNDNEELISKLVPQFPVGCRRITPGHGYLEALQKDNVSLIFDPISRITDKGIITQRPNMSEHEEEFDLVVCATGFDVSFSPAFELRGQNGISLASVWSKNPEAYLGIFAPQMPNYAIYNGPNTPIGHGSLMGAMEATTTLILNMIKKLATQGYKSFCVKDEVIREYNDYAQEWLKDSVWAAGCSSWYKRSSDGRVTAMYPGSILHYREMLEHIRLEDFEWQVKLVDGKKPNRFKFMGNGTTQLEADQGQLGDYLEM